MRKGRHAFLTALYTSLGAALLPSIGHAADAMDRLAADPDQLRRIEKQCQSDWAATGDAMCVAASRARRARFLRRRPSDDLASTTETTRRRGVETAEPRPSAPAGEAD